MSTTEKQRIISDLNDISRSVIRMSCEISDILDTINSVYLRCDDLTPGQFNFLTTLHNSIIGMQGDTIRAETMTTTLKQSVYVNLKIEIDGINKFKQNNGEPKESK